MPEGIYSGPYQLTVLISGTGVPGHSNHSPIGTTPASVLVDSTNIISHGQLPIQP